MSKPTAAIELTPKFSLVTPAILAARARAAAAQRKQQQQQGGPNLRKRSNKKYGSDFEDSDDSDDDHHDHDELQPHGQGQDGAVDLGDSTDDEDERINPLVALTAGAEDGKDEEKHYGKRRLVGSYETAHAHVPRQLLWLREKEKEKTPADKLENLVPIRLDLELDGYKIKDLFTWNSNEKFMTPEQFANILVADLDIPKSLIPLIVGTIQSQIDAYAPLEDVVFEEREDGRSSSIVLIQLDLSVGKLNLRDRFEWDLNCRDVTPEMFAKQLAADLGIGGEFPIEIANSIREQILAHKQKKIIDEERDYQLPEVLIRDEDNAKFWTPVLNVLTEQELEKISEEQERAARRRRRQNRDEMEGAKAALKARARYVTVNQNPNPEAVHIMQWLHTEIEAEDETEWQERKRQKLAQRRNRGNEFSGCCLHCRDEAPQRFRGPSGPNTLCQACSYLFETRGHLPRHRKDLFRTPTESSCPSPSPSPSMNLEGDPSTLDDAL